MSEHSKLSPSAAERWLECPVAPAREQTFPDKDNDAAAEGTAAHHMAAYCLDSDIHISAKDAPADARWDKWDSPVFRDHVQTYLDFVRSKLTVTSHLFVEQKLSILPEFDVWGTADTVIVDGSTLRIVDLKFGQGVLVSPDDNPQLFLYGWGGYDTLEWLASEPITHIEVSICQPRRENTVSKTFTADELKRWMVDHLPKVRKAYHAIATDTATPGAHCMWCRARRTCVERAQFNLATAGMDFADITGPVCEPINPTEIDEDMLAAIFLRLPLLEKWIKDVETEVAERAKNHHINGLKWVAGRNMRYITDPDAAGLALELSGIAPWAERKLLGFGDLEKAVKAAGLKLTDLIGNFIDTKQSNPVLVAETDKRPAIESSAKSDFAA
jgi:hypothetical protein